MRHTGNQDKTGSRITQIRTGICRKSALLIPVFSKLTIKDENKAKISILGSIILHHTAGGLRTENGFRPGGYGTGM